MLSSASVLGGGDVALLKYSLARPGNLGAGSGGSIGEDEISSSKSSTVEVLEKAGELGEVRCETPWPSCAEARGGDDSVWGDVFIWPK